MGDEELAEAEEGAGRLEAALRERRGGGAAGGPAVERAYREAERACARCHARFRDAGREP